VPHQPRLVRRSEQVSKYPIECSGTAVFASAIARPGYAQNVEMSVDLATSCAIPLKVVPSSLVTIQTFTIKDASDA
jgi:hypothetical protein